MLPPGGVEFIQVLAHFLELAMEGVQLVTLKCHLPPQQGQSGQHPMKLLSRKRNRSLGLWSAMLHGLGDRMAQPRPGWGAMEAPTGCLLDPAGLLGVTEGFRQIAEPG
jgi:hypothetical protein